MGLLVAPVYAQSDTAADPPTAFLTLDLAAGYPLDPFIVSLNGGGPIAANTLAEECTGYVSERPTITVNWSGEAEFVEAFFYSDHDPVLVVETPDGSYLCNDDANDQLLDPVVQIDAPAAGEYKIWVGSYDEAQLIPGVLVLTTRPEVNLGTFDLGGLVKRPAITENLVESEDVDRPSAPTTTITGTARLTASVAATVTANTLSAESLPFTASVAVSGTIAAFEFPQEDDVICNGLLEATPSATFNWEGADASLHIFFESDTDATLYVAGPDGQVFCNDDSVDDEIDNDDIEVELNLNPMVTIENAAPGTYTVYVGRLEDTVVVDGVLTVSAAPDAKPALLKDLDEGEE